MTLLISVVAAATGYVNLSAHLSRSVALELLLLFGVLFVDHLVLRVGEGDDGNGGWRKWARRGLWTAALLAQIPIWRLHSYHASYAADLLKRSIISVEGAEVTPLSILKGFVLILVVYVVGRFIRFKVQNWKGLQERFQAGVIYALSNLAFYAILAGGVIWGILASGFQLSVLTVFAGMAGIGLGFGLQDIVGNFVSGLILLIERPAAVGDYVDLGDLQGTIDAINLRSTAIRTRDGNLVLVPNSDLASSRLTNFTIADPKLRVHVAVGVSYDTDLNVVYGILNRVSVEDPDVLAEPDPIIRLTGFGDNSVDFELLAWVASPDIMEDVGPRLRKRIWDAFLEANVEIPFPQRDLHIRSSDIALPGHDPGAGSGD